MAVIYEITIVEATMLLELSGSGLVCSNAALKRALPAVVAVPVKVSVVEAPEASDGVAQVMFWPDTVPPPLSDTLLNILEKSAVSVAF